MYAYVTSQTASVRLPLEDFLESGLVRDRARTAMCTPEELVADHLPPFDQDDGDEMREAIAEACEWATEGDASAIRLDENDLKFARVRLFGGAPEPIPFPQPLDAA